MTMKKIVSYLRVSTQKQGQSGLGIEAQRAAVERYALENDCQIIEEFVEVESGKKDDRPKLEVAMRSARIRGAKLVIAKLDRLSRDAAFLLGLAKAGVDFVAADMPNANRLTVGIMAVVAEEERRMISERTKAAMAAAKARGTVLGGWRGKSVADKARWAAGRAKAEKSLSRAKDVLPIINEAKVAGYESLTQIAAYLTAQGIPTARGCQNWTAKAVSRVMERLPEQQDAA
jgi:DNA invertase Pin-like site-specific DNA recombinase